MLTTFDELSKLIEDGKVLHVAGSEKLLRKLPKGSWIGGSSEYFMTEEGGLTSSDKLFVTEFPSGKYKIRNYGVEDISQVAVDAFDNGFSMIIIPFDSPVHVEYSCYAAEYEQMFIKPIIGWIAGTRLDATNQIPMAVNGATGEILTDKAVVLHLAVQDHEFVNIGSINIHEIDEQSPTIEFEGRGDFQVTTCLIDGERKSLADYIERTGYDIRLPIVGDYSGQRINVSIRKIEGDVVHLYAPVFSEIKYKFAKLVSDYATAFDVQLKKLNETDALFSCNCILNFIYGELEGEKISAFHGPITFGEVAYQLLNQTLVYVKVN